MNCILFLAHQDNDFVRSQIERIRSEVDPDKYELWLLYNGETCGIPCANKFFFNEKSVTDAGFKIHRYYPDGDSPFYGNNAELSFMSFYKAHPEYDNYWLVEFDVYCLGNWGDCLEFYDGKGEGIDYYGTFIERYGKTNKAWPWWDLCWNDTFEIKEKVRCFNPIARFSGKALATLLRVYSEGENYGFYEVFMPSVFYSEGLKMSAMETGKGSDAEFKNNSRDAENFWIDYKDFTSKPRSVVRMKKNHLYHPVKGTMTRCPLGLGWAFNKKQD